MPTETQKQPWFGWKEIVLGFTIAVALIAAVLFWKMAPQPEPGRQPLATVTANSYTVVGGWGNVSAFLAYVRDDSEANTDDYNDGMLINMAEQACLLGADNFTLIWHEHNPDVLQAITDGITLTGPYLCDNLIDPWGIGTDVYGSQVE